jgi:transposase InsO family protein
VPLDATGRSGRHHDKATSLRLLSWRHWSRAEKHHQSNLLGFYAAAPNQKWLTDLAELQIPAGKVYLSPVIDFFDGLVVNWSIGTRPDAELVYTMLDSAIESVAGCEERSVVHSDRGAHYRCPGSLLRMQAAKLARSMSRKGCSPDNTACGGFFGRQQRSCLSS